eukprot:356133-Chlamydomonas_euryale.AAC.17
MEVDGTTVYRYAFTGLRRPGRVPVCCRKQASARTSSFQLWTIRLLGAITCTHCRMRPKLPATDQLTAESKNLYALLHAPYASGHVQVDSWRK